MSNLKIAVKGEREIVITRQFNAPRKLVFEAFTRPELLKRWLFGPDGWELAVCEIDLRVGGKYRWVWSKKDGTVQMGAGGEYREVTPHSRIVSTERFDDPWYPGECIGTLEFTEKAGRTTLTQTLLYESRQARDAVIQSPMESGLAEGYDRLATIVEAA